MFAPWATARPARYERRGAFVRSPLVWAADASEVQDGRCCVLVDGQAIRNEARGSSKRITGFGEPGVDRRESTRQPSAAPCSGSAGLSQLRGLPTRPSVSTEVCPQRPTARA